MSRPRTNERGQIQRSNGSDHGGATNLAAMLQHSLAPQIKNALPKHLDADRMTRVALTALRTTPKLMECEPWSFAASILQASQLGLEVNTPLGHAYLIPRWNSKAQRTECTLQIGYQGMIALARRSGEVSSIYAFTVHKGDTFEYELGLDPKIRHVPHLDLGARDESSMTFVYAVAKLKGGEDDRQFVVLTKREVDERKARGAGGPAWRSDYLAMARKTAVRALFTFLPKSPEMARVQAVDDAEVHGSLVRSLDVDVTEALESMQLPQPQDDGEVVDTEEAKTPADYIAGARDADTLYATIRAPENREWIIANPDAAREALSAAIVRTEADPQRVEELLAD